MLDKLVRVASLSPAYQQAARAAVEAQRQAYAPYSNFGVGAALVHMDNSITAGCNYENCTLQACCAERCAIARANVEGRRTAKAIAVFGRSLTPATAAATAPLPTSVCPPCGLCRQLLVEVADLSSNYNTFEIIFVTNDETSAAVLRLADLMPQKFGPSDIGVDVSKLALPRDQA